MVKLEDFNSHLKNLDAKDWQKLFDFIPKIEEAQLPQNTGEAQLASNDSTSFPHFEHAELSGDFLSLVHTIEICPVFDWMNWEEGRKILENPIYAFEGLDMITLCKLLTMIIRADRFNEGYLLENLNNGIIKAILNSLRDKIQPNKD